MFYKKWLVLTPTGAATSDWMVLALLWTLTTKVWSPWDCSTTVHGTVRAEPSLLSLTYSSIRLLESEITSTLTSLITTHNIEVLLDRMTFISKLLFIVGDIIFKQGGLCESWLLLLLGAWIFIFLNFNNKGIDSNHTDPLNGQSGVITNHSTGFLKYRRTFISELLFILGDIILWQDGLCDSWLLILLGAWITPF